jgi:hypothetical protein
MGMESSHAHRRQPRGRASMTNQAGSDQQGEHYPPPWQAPPPYPYPYPYAMPGTSIDATAVRELRSDINTLTRAFQQFQVDLPAGYPTRREHEELASRIRALEAGDQQGVREQYEERIALEQRLGTIVKEQLQQHFTGQLSSGRRMDDKLSGFQGAIIGILASGFLSLLLYLLTK